MQDIKNLLSEFNQECNNVNNGAQTAINLVDYVDKFYSTIASLNKSYVIYNKHVDELYEASEKLNKLIKEATIKIATKSTPNGPMKETIELNIDYSYCESCKQAIRLVLNNAKSFDDLFRVSNYVKKYATFTNRQSQIDKRLSELQDDSDNNKQPDRN